jgi:ABC-2 type transport system ATP-binding protein
MDEPTDGLDPNQKHEMRVLISDMARNKAIVVSTHILEEVNALCTRAIIIAQGKLLFDGTPAQLEQRSKYHNAITLKGKLPSADAAAAALRALPNIAAVDVSDNEAGRACLTIVPVNGAAIVNEVSQLVREKGWMVDELRVEAGRLDEVFRSITTPSGAAGQEVLT